METTHSDFNWIATLLTALVLTNLSVVWVALNYLT
jgi:hypothetical protein